MPLQFIFDNIGFFGALLGAVAGWGGSYGAMRVTQHIMNERMSKLESKAECFVKQSDYDRDRNICQDQICRKLEAIDKRIQGLNELLLGMLLKERWDIPRNSG